MEISKKRVTHDDFIKLVGKRVVKTSSSRGGVALGNKDFVTIIGSHLEGKTFVGGLIGKSCPKYTWLVYEAGLEYCSTIYIYKDVYIFKEDKEPFREDKASRLVAGTYGVYIGYGSKDNYLLLVKKIQ